MAQHNCRLLNWNVRGLNDGAKQDAVNELVRDTGATIVCLQETKLQIMDQSAVSRTAGPKFANSFAVLPAAHTRGGILLAVNEDFFDLSDIQLSTHAITATITMRADRIQWQINVVYGPQRDDEKIQFLQELKNIPVPAHDRWLILGDFNLIYQAEDKNNSNLNRRLMNSFKAALDVMRLKEIKLNGRRFTWSNEQTNPTLTRIDRLFCTPNGIYCFRLASFTPCRLLCPTTHRSYFKETLTIAPAQLSGLRISGPPCRDSKTWSKPLGSGRLAPSYPSNASTSKWQG